MADDVVLVGVRLANHRDAAFAAGDVDPLIGTFRGNVHRVDAMHLAQTLFANGFFRRVGRERLAGQGQTTSLVPRLSVLYIPFSEATPDKSAASEMGAGLALRSKQQELKVGEQVVVTRTPGARTFDR